MGTSRYASSSAQAGRIDSNGAPGTAACPASARIVVTVPSAGAAYRFTDLTYRGQPLRAVSVDFVNHRPGDVRPYEDFFGGPVRFVCGGSGHIAGIVNPPAAQKYQHWTNESMPATPEQWFEGAKATPGSWWPEPVRW